LAIASNLIPTFQFTRPLTANSISISRTALAKDDLGFGFRVLAPDGSAVRHNTPHNRCRLWFQHTNPIAKHQQNF
jgi:hypothetical protein